jgi:hypothetical protein
MIYRLLVACVLVVGACSTKVLTGLNDTTWGDILGTHACLVIFTCNVNIGYTCKRMDVDAAHVAATIDNCAVARTESIKHQQHLRRYETNACLYEAGLETLHFSSTISWTVLQELNTYWNVSGSRNI